MVSHILLDITQEASSHNRDTAERNANIVHPLVSFSVCELAGLYNHLVCSLIASNARDVADLVQQRGTGQFDYFANQLDIGDVELLHHYSTNVVCCLGNKLGDEDVVVDGVANAAAYYANREGECRDSGNKILERG